MISFTVSDVVDTGGQRYVDCTSETEVPAEAVDYTWVITKPDGTTVPEDPSLLPEYGPFAYALVDQPGTYSCIFTASVNRECRPSEITIGLVSVDTCTGARNASEGGPTCGLQVTWKEITFGTDHTKYEETPPYSVYSQIHKKGKHHISSANPLEDWLSSSLMLDIQSCLEYD
jgi:hypothetical protein